MNRLKDAFREKRTTVGLWQALANGLTAEICAGAGYDWLMFDAEHGPNTLTTLLAQLQAVSAYPLEPVVRPPVGDPVIIKQVLDMGVRTLLIPMVDTAEQARRRQRHQPGLRLRHEQHVSRAGPSRHLRDHADRKPQRPRSDRSHRGGRGRR